VNAQRPSATARRSWVELQALGPDLATGLRAALATVIPLVLSVQLARPELAWMAFGGWLGTLADPGGSRGRRARVLVAFVPLGPLLVCGGQHIASLTAVAVVTFAAIAGTASLLRAFGPAAGGLGTILAIVAAISTSIPSADALLHALWFGGGGVIALLLSSILWPVWTHLPVRRALAHVHEELAAYADALAASIANGHSEAEWTALARSHPRKIRDAIEQARAVSLAVYARRFGESVMGSNLRVLLGLAEAQFLLLVTLATELERVPTSPGTVEALRRLSRRFGEVRSVLVARAWRSPEEEDHPPVPASVADPAGLLPLLERESAKSMIVVGALGQERPPQPAQNVPSTPTTGPLTHETVRLRDVLSPSSPIFRHAVRVTVAAAVAAALGAWLSPSHAAWVSITTVAVLQPYTGTTMKLAAERVVGTVLGCLLVVGVAAASRSPLVLALLMFPMSMAAVVTRPRSYRLFTFFVTPVFVLIALRSPGDWSTAAMRAGDVLLGGAVAVASALLIYPRWEERIGLPGALAAMIRAVEAYRDTVLSAPGLREPQDMARITETRRAAGLAISEAETSLERRLAEPMRRGDDEARALEQITFARRLAHSVTALDTLTTTAPDAAPPTEAMERVGSYSELLLAAATPSAA
jgi:uncharacterized membrane protein YccC